VRSPSLISLCLLGLAAFALAMAQESRAPAQNAARDARTATVLEIKGPIGPATSHFIEKGIRTALAQNSRLVILQIDTPGGLDTAMRDIIRAILASPIPIVSYVSPSGARAASAGAYILYASHLAAMAPATNVGAATPVSIGGEQPRSRRSRDEPGILPEDRDADSQKDAREKPGDSAAKDKTTAPANDEPSDRKPNIPEPETAMERKVINDAVAYLRSLAELRGRNADWAELAVRTGASLSATAALQQHVIEVVARDLPDLLAQIDGRQIKVGQRTVTVDTKGLVLQRIDPDWRTQLLSALTNPTIAYGLLLIGIYGLLLEGYNPGAIVPGVVGAIALLLALFAFQILSVNYAGLALVALGIGMIIAEFFVPSFGSLGLGGLIAFVVGSIILLDTDVPGLDIATPVIAGVATAGGLVVFAIAYVASRSIRKPVVTGTESMLGERAEVVEDFDRQGFVRVRGELWNAHTTVPLRAGQSVRIVKLEGLSLWVEPV
jgi:membrane-bound serine protease (ClpP class)